MLGPQFFSKFFNHIGQKKVILHKHINVINSIALTVIREGPEGIHYPPSTIQLSVTL